MFQMLDSEDREIEAFADLVDAVEAMRGDPRGHTVVCDGIVYAYSFRAKAKIVQRRAAAAKAAAR